MDNNMMPGYGYGGFQPFLWLYLSRLHERQAVMEGLTKDAVHESQVWGQRNVAEAKSAVAASTQILQNGQKDMAAALAECCCKLGLGQKDIELAIQKCCCETQLGLERVQNQLSSEHCETRLEGERNTQRILDAIADQTAERLRGELADAKSAVRDQQILAAIATAGGSCNGGPPGPPGK